MLVHHLDSWRVETGVECDTANVVKRRAYGRLYIGVLSGDQWSRGMMNQPTLEGVARYLKSQDVAIVQIWTAGEDETAGEIQSDHEKTKERLLSTICFFNTETWALTDKQWKSMEESYEGLVRNFRMDHQKRRNENGTCENKKVLKYARQENTITKTTAKNLDQEM